jgi:serine protease
MKFLLAAVVFASVLAPAGAQPVETTSRLIVRFRETVQKAHLMPTQQVAELAASTGIPLAHQRRMALGAQLVALPSRVLQADAEALAARLAGHPDVAWAQADGRVFPQLTPNDSLLSSLGYLQNTPAGISALAAWDITTGSAGTVVAVLDTGYRPHFELAGRVLPGYDFISDPLVANDGDGRDADASDPGDWVTAADRNLPQFGDCPVRSSSWHGTAVAGVIAANANNGRLVAGINWAASILPVRVLGKCGGSTSDIIDAVAWAGGLDVPGVPANAHPAQVINLSLGGEGSCGAGYRAVFAAVLAHGATRAIVAAAGNEDDDVAGHSPANCPEVLAIASTTANSGRLASYSNFGSGITLSAPGGDFSAADGPTGITVISNYGFTTPTGDGFRGVGGTSFAAPMVAGVASLMLAVAPDLSPGETRSLLLSTVKPFPAGSDCTTARCGAGIVNAEAAVQAAKVAAPVDPTVLRIVEYFHAAFGHYFVTAKQDEIAKLDDGSFAGWTRTGYGFKAYATPRAGTVPVCRFFTVAFPPKSSHFYTPDAAECAKVKTNPDWTFEAEVFHAGLPGVDGSCAAGTIPVYRLYNDGQTGAPNHRYTTDAGVRDQMLAQRFVSEGVGLCSPP